MQLENERESGAANLKPSSEPRGQFTQPNTADLHKQNQPNLSFTQKQGSSYENHSSVHRTNVISPTPQTFNTSKPPSQQYSTSARSSMISPVNAPPLPPPMPPASSTNKASAMSPVESLSRNPSNSNTSSNLKYNPSNTNFNTLYSNFSTSNSNYNPSNSNYNGMNLRSTNVSPTPTQLQNQLQQMKSKEEARPIHRQSSRESISRSSSYGNGRETPVSFR